MRIVAILLFLAALVSSCGGSKIKQSPLDELKKEFTSKEAYTILLQDMDLQGEQQVHKYTVITFKKDKSYTIDKTKWYNVEEDFFRLHDGDLGMEILSKVPNGDYNNLPSPPGFTQVIGKGEYGYWEQKIVAIDTLDGVVDTLLAEVPQSVWRFHDKNQDLKKALELDSLDILRGEYDEFMSSYHMNRPYYGVKEGTSQTRYGTYGYYWLLRRPMFYSRRTQKGNFYSNNMRARSTNTRGGGGFGK